MRGGQLDTMITIQRSTVTQSPSGAPIETWATLSTRPAMLTSLTGYERLTTEQLVAREQVSFTIRWADVIDDVSPRDRIICPASAAANSPSEQERNMIYDILWTELIGRNEGLKIFAAVRQDEIT